MSSSLSGNNEGSNTMPETEDKDAKRSSGGDRHHHHHLFILFQHGSHGEYGHFKTMQQEILTRFDDYLLRSSSSCSVSGPQEDGDRTTTTTLKMWGTDVNAGFRSDRGTITCAERLVVELRKELTLWIQEKKRGGDPAAVVSPSNDDDRDEFFFSCVGHSFGGVILREALQQLFSRESSSRQGWWHLRTAASEKKEPSYNNITTGHIIKPISFLSCASPHFGVSDISRNVLGGGVVAKTITFGARLVGQVYSTTFKDLFLDTDVLTEKRLANKETHLKYLRDFKKVRLFGNLHGDPQVSFHSSTGCQVTLVAGGGKSTISAAGKADDDDGHLSSNDPCQEKAKDEIREKRNILPAQCPVGSMEVGRSGIPYRLTTAQWEAIGDPSVKAAIKYYSLKEEVVVGKDNKEDSSTKSNPTGPDFLVAPPPPPPPQQLALAKIFFDTVGEDDPERIVVHPVVHHSDPNSNWSLKYMTVMRVHDSIIGQNRGVVDVGMPEAPAEVAKVLVEDFFASIQI